MVEPIEQDSRGILDPNAAQATFRLDRFDPSPEVARFVDRYWVVSWELPAGTTHEQEVLTHPAVNVVFEPSGAGVHGVQRRRQVQQLEGAGWALGIMFRPAGFRPFLGRSLAGITGRRLELAEVFGPASVDSERRVSRAPDAEAMVAAADRFLAARTPVAPQPGERISAVVERIAADPALVRVDELSRRLSLSPRHLQRLFADQVGVSPKWVIRRYRLYEAAGRAAAGTDVNWA
ncbi:MAG: DUF6597 domain-containing transcriptional factor, partial [Acidimicrobiales bacterium]